MVLAAHHQLNITEQHLDAAFQWLCKQRINYPSNADIWSFRFNWQHTKTALLKHINSGDYTFSPIKRIRKANGQTIHLWCSQDALVLKLMAMQLHDELTLEPSCTHIKGHGGLKQCVVAVQQQLKDYNFVCKTDVKHFYQSIDHTLLLDQLYSQIDNKALRRYLYQVIRRTAEYGGNYWDITKGIARGCPISPLLGALYLTQLDLHFKQHGLFYIRYMDDILILTTTRWHNRTAVRQLNQIFNHLKVQQHPDKTFIGRISKGFDFLGYHFSNNQLQLASITVRKHVFRIAQL